MTLRGSRNSSPHSRRPRLTLCLLALTALSATAWADTTHTIRGRIVCGLLGFGIPNVEMYGLPGNPETNGDGYYVATVPDGWSGAVYPLSSGLHFDPFGHNYVNVTADIVDNYKTALPVPSIWGYIKTEGGEPVPCVSMTGVKGAPMTNAHGYYLTYVDSGWSGTLTPQKTGWLFNPGSRTFFNVRDDQGQQNFTGYSSPGITVSPVSGLTTTEAGGTAAFSVALTGPPTANVVIPVSSGDTTEGTVSTAALTFTPANWSLPQGVTVTGVDDALRDGDVAYTVTLGAAGSADPAYNGVKPPDVSVTNLDNDTPGITVNPTAGLVTTEAGGTAQFQVGLNALPTANVTIGLSSSDPGEGTVSPASLTFTPANWGAPQVVTVTGVDDAVTDGDVAYTIVTAAAVSADPGYSGLNPPNVAVTNRDDDLPPVLQVGPTTTVDFGRVVIGEASEIDAFIVANAGGKRLTGTAAVAGSFAVVSGGTFDLGPGQTQTVRVRFAPTTTGTETQNVTFTSNAGSATRTVSGRGRVWYLVVDNRDAAVGKNFQILSGSWSTSTSLRSYWADDYRYTATGDGSAVAAWSFRVTEHAVYQISAWWPGYSWSSASNAPYTIYHAAGSTVVRADQRSNSGKWNALGTFELTPGTDWRVELSNNANGSSVLADAIRIRWVRNVAPVLEVTPAAATDFGLALVGSPKELNAYTVRNTGEGNLVGQATATAPFAVVAGGTFDLPAGASQTVRIRFLAPGQGAYNGTVSFTSNGGQATRALTGTGALNLPPQLTVEPAGDVEFGSVLVGFPTELDAYTVRNDGGDPLTGSVSVGGEFSIVSGGTFNLAGGASQVVRIRFAPTTLGIHAETVTFTSNAGNATRTVRGVGSLLIIDNRDDEPDKRFEVLSAKWSTTSRRPECWDSDYRQKRTGDGSALVAWYYRVPTDGVYEVSAWWPRSSRRWATAAPYRVYDRNGDTVVPKDQTTGGGAWNRLGLFEFTAGPEWRVELSNASPGSQIVADAIRLVYAGPLPSARMAKSAKRVILPPAVPAAEPLAIFATPERGQAPLEVLLEACNVPPGATCRWDFGDGSKGRGDAAIHTYWSPGLYTVVLTAGEATARATIVVQEPPRPSRR